MKLVSVHFQEHKLGTKEALSMGKRLITHGPSFCTICIFYHVRIKSFNPKAFF